MESMGSLINNIESPISKRINGFTKVPNSLIATTYLNTYEKMVWIVIQKHKMNKNECWPSLETIAKGASCSTTTVKKTIKALEQKRLVLKINSKKRRNNIYQSTSNMYWSSDAQVSGH